MPADLGSIVAELRAMAVGTSLEGMKRYGIRTENALGVSLPKLRKLAESTGKNHEIALGLWKTGIHEAQILAALVDVPAEVTEAQMDRWAHDFDSWDVCDTCCANLLDKTRFAYSKAIEWSGEEQEFVKRAGFALMAALAVHDKRQTDEAFTSFLPCILRGATDERNFVRKAVNWALRQVGKRNLTLNKEAIRVAREMQKADNRAARWVAADALRELNSPSVQERLRQRARRR